MKELIRSTTMPIVRMTHLSSEQRELLPLAVGEFLDTAATATARATFYNTRAEQGVAVETVHRDLFELDRGIYTAALLLPGVTDFSRYAYDLTQSDNLLPDFFLEESEEAYEHHDKPW